jgi:hypothetical protein
VLCDATSIGVGYFNTNVIAIVLAGETTGVERGEGCLGRQRRDGKAADDEEADISFHGIRVTVRTEFVGLKFVVQRWYTGLGSKPGVGSGDKT